MAHGQLAFASEARLRAAVRELIEDPCADDSAIVVGDLHADGNRLTVEVDLQLPASCWSPTLHLLSSLADASTGGSVRATLDVDAVVVRVPDPAGDDDEQDDDDEEDDLATPDWRVREAARKGALSRLKQLFAAGGDPEQAPWGTSKSVREALAAGAHPDGRDGKGAPLCRAVATGNTAAARALVAAGASLDVTDPETGYTPLMFAARRGEVRLLQVLAQRGANLEARTETGDTALFVALGLRDWWRREQIVRALLEAGADAGAVRADGTEARGLVEHIQRTTGTLVGVGI